MKLSRFWGDKCNTEKCIYCKQDLSTNSIMKYKGCDWVCLNCMDKLQYKINDYVWFPKYNKETDCIDIQFGKILGLCYDRVETYILEYKNKKDTFVTTKVSAKYIGDSKEEVEHKCTDTKTNEEIEDIEQPSRDDDLMVMAQQSMVYDIIKNFLKTDLANEFKITGIDVNIENGYVNAEWKFGNRKKNDIIE